MSMHKDCEFFAHSVQYNPRDDQSFASWGSRLMHLSMVCENQVMRDRVPQWLLRCRRAA